MKLHKIIPVLALAALLFLAACTKNELIPFTQPASVYFGSPTISGVPKTSVDYSFAKYPSRAVDTIKLTVALLGDAATFDREIKVLVADTSIANAKEGVEFKLLPPYKLAANAYSATIPVVVYRTGPMDSITYTFVLKLAASEQLGIGISAQSEYKIRLAYLQKPSTWDLVNGSEGWAHYSANLGTWTKTKYKLVLDALHNPVSDTTITEFPFGRFQPPTVYTQYLQMVRNYILKNYPGNYSIPLGVGPTLRDPDANNLVIQVGPSNY